MKNKKKKTHKRKRKQRKLKNLLTAVVISSGIYLLLFLMMFSIVKVKDYGMLPNAHYGELVLVRKQAEIKRFDLVYVENPLNRKDRYIRRVIGVSGDEIHYQEDDLFINGQGKLEPYLNATKEKIKPLTLTEDFDLYKLTKRSSVPKGHYFLLGDNRQSASDSRNFGYVPEDLIIGKVVLPIR